MHLYYFVEMNESNTSRFEWTNEMGIRTIEEKNQFNIIEVTPLFIPFVFHNSRKTKRNNTRTREEQNEYQKIQPNACAVWSLLLLLLLLLLWRRRFFSSLVKNMNHRNIYISALLVCRVLVD